MKTEGRKNKKQLFLSAVFAGAGIMMITACGSNQNDASVTTSAKMAGTTTAVTACTVQDVTSDVQELTAAQTTQAQDTVDSVKLNVDLSKGASDYFIASDGWTNGSVFNCNWKAENCTFSDGVMNLSIDHDDTTGNGILYSGAEYRSNDFYGYGYYEVSMKAMKNDGVVSSFFTYTGPSDNNPWDEIDVEVLGKDTSKVQFNYYRDGVGGHEYMYDLGFDASEDFHTYAFDWEPGSITWYVDGVKAYDLSGDVPVTPGKIMMNAWNGINVDDWLKPFDDSKLPICAQYKSIKYHK